MDENPTTLETLRKCFIHLKMHDFLQHTPVVCVGGSYGKSIVSVAVAALLNEIYKFNVAVLQSSHILDARE